MKTRKLNKSVAKSSQEFIRFHIKCIFQIIIELFTVKIFINLTTQLQLRQNEGVVPSKSIIEIVESCCTTAGAL